MKTDYFSTHETSEIYFEEFKSLSQTYISFESYNKILINTILPFAINRMLFNYKELVEYLGWTDFSDMQLNHIGFQVLENLQKRILDYCTQYEYEAVTIPPIQFFSTKNKEGLTRIETIISEELYNLLIFIAPLLKGESEKIDELKKERDEFERNSHGGNYSNESDTTYNRNKYIFELIFNGTNPPEVAFELAQKKYPLKNVNSIKAAYHSFLRLHPKDVQKWKNSIK